MGEETADERGSKKKECGGAGRFPAAPKRRSQPPIAVRLPRRSPVLDSALSASRPLRLRQRTKSNPLSAPPFLRPGRDPQAVTNRCAPDTSSGVLASSCSLVIDLPKKNANLSKCYIFEIHCKRL